MVGAVIGLLFAGVSTFDFTQHLDRQVHDIHCSFVPGLGGEGGSTESGCQVTMMSPYSSILRTTVWGGIPISLAAMSVFAFLLLFCVELLVTRRLTDRRATGFLALACGLPAVSSVVMATISFATLGTACKLCVGIYFASAVSLVAAIVVWRISGRIGGANIADVSRAETELSEPSGSTPGRYQESFASAPPVGLGYLATRFAIGCLVVLLPTVGYVTAAPDHSRFVGSCGALADSSDRYSVMVPLGSQSGGVSAIEVFDPLCPACRALEHRLESSDLAEDIDRKLLLFPLDNACNWMVNDSLHPGACVVSEAILCAGAGAEQVVSWAFDNQEALTRAGSSSEDDVRAMIKAKFPRVASCLGSPAVKAKLNKSMRWVVRNQLPVLTPQLFVNGVKLCDEDVDLGLDFALSRLIRGDLGAAPKTPELVEERRPILRAPPKPLRAAPATPGATGAAQPDRASAKTPVEGPAADTDPSADTSPSAKSPTKTEVPDSVGDKPTPATPDKLPPPKVSPPSAPPTSAPANPAPPKSGSPPSAPTEQSNKEHK